MKKIIEFILFSTIFINGIILFRTPFEGYHYYLIALLFIPLFMYKYGFPKVPFKVLFIPGFIGIIQILLGNNEMYVFIKIWGGLLFLLTFFHGLIEYYNYDVNRLFNVYLKWSVVIAYIGIIQVISFIIGFKLGYDYTWIFNKWAIHSGSLFFIRLNSFFSEPAQFAITMAPAVFIALRSIFDNKTASFEMSRKSAFVILSAYLMTTSSVAYLGFLTIIFIYLIEKRQTVYLVLIVIIIPLLSVIAYKNIDEVRVRADSFYGLAVLDDFSIKNVNNSSFVLYNNFTVAWRNFLDHPLGTGLGSHPIAFKKYSLTNSGNIFKLEFNAKDGNSTFVRLLSETGIIGIGFLVWLLVGSFSKESKGSASYILSTSLLVLIILHLFRQGNYFVSGFPFFVLLYYYNGIKSKENLRLSEQNTDQIIDSLDNTLK